MPTKNPTKEQKRQWNWSSRYGITPRQYAQMTESQKNLCAICGEEMRRPVVDHNHETGAVRALLCHPCNVILPAIENREWAGKAAAYLARH